MKYRFGSPGGGGGGGAWEVREERAGSRIPRLQEPGEILQKLVEIAAE